MWDTSKGLRTLDRAEAYLIRELIHYLLDQILVGIEIDEPHRTDVPIFDALQPTQQLVMLHEVATGLLNSKVDPVPLCAINEATIYAMFCELRSLIEIEIDFQRRGKAEKKSIRSAVIDAWQQHQLWGQPAPGDHDNDDPMIPTSDCTDVDQWSWFVELVADQILWDRDFDLDSLVADIHPQRAHLLTQHLGIQRDYYATVAPDVLDVDIDSISDLIRDLVPQDANR